MIDVRKFDSLGHADHGWLNARHHFSFASYYDASRMGWGRIRVWNDDTIGAKSGFPPQGLDKMKTWTAAFILLGNKFRELGLSGGVEGVLKSSFTSDGKKIGELESNLEQLSFFDKLPEAAQRSLLEGAIDDNKAMDAEFAGMLKAWTAGDVQGIARTFDRDLSGSPALQHSLIHQRNANWSKWIEQRMTKPGSVSTSSCSTTLTAGGNTGT